MAWQGWGPRDRAFLVVVSPCQPLPAAPLIGALPSPPTGAAKLRSSLLEMQMALLSHHLSWLWILITEHLSLC